MSTSIAILGAGSWGTAIALHLARCGNQVKLWSHRPDHAEAMIQTGKNERYLPDNPFPPSLSIETELKRCVQETEYCIIGVPSHAFAKLIHQIPKPKHGIAWLTKGLDPLTHSLLSELVIKEWGKDYPFAIISGPSFAKEVANNMPTALTLASNNLNFQQLMQNLLHQYNIRVYPNPDFIGVQICGAVKNVLAIACGISDGLGYGANARSALITRGLTEMRRLGIALGSNEETFNGLAGLGDLVLTCTDNQSRNRRFGLFLGQGKEAQKAEKEIGQVVEGRYNAAQVRALAEMYHVDMPICFQVDELLQGRITAQQAAMNLMQRAKKTLE